jgi:hypothetical protein
MPIERFTVPVDDRSGWLIGKPSQSEAERVKIIGTVIASDEAMVVANEVPGWVIDVGEGPSLVVFGNHLEAGDYLPEVGDRVEVIAEPSTSPDHPDRFFALEIQKLPD